MMVDQVFQDNPTSFISQRLDQSGEGQVDIHPTKDEELHPPSSVDLIAASKETNGDSHQEMKIPSYSKTPGVKNADLDVAQHDDHQQECEQNATKSTKKLPIMEEHDQVIDKITQKLALDHPIGNENDAQAAEIILDLREDELIKKADFVIKAAKESKELFLERIQQQGDKILEDPLDN